MSHQSLEAIMIDTGGLVHDHGDLSAVIQEQTKLAIEESDLILFLVDARQGLLSNDQEIARQLRKENKPMILVVNKTEGTNREESAAEFFALGLLVNRTVFPHSVEIIVTPLKSIFLNFCNRI